MHSIAKRLAVNMAAHTTALLCAITTLVVPAQAQETKPAQKACQDARFRQFDFWIGHWDVSLPDGSKAGENRIAAIAGGCALLESWTGRGGFTGMSLNSLDKNDGKWRQVWVDSSGGRLDLAGGIEGSAMVMSSTAAHPKKPGVQVTQRITWTPSADGSLRQHWETSEDGGRTWTTVFDGKYARKR